jgi:AraC-like DNA-binding protein
LVEAIIKKQPANYQFESLTYEYSQIIYIKRGKLFLHTKNEEKAMKSGCAVCLPKESSFKLFCRSGKGYEGIAAIYPEMENFISFTNPIAFVATPGVREIADLIEQEIYSPKFNSQSILDGLINSFAGLCLRLAAQNKHGDPYQANASFWADNVKQTIERLIYSSESINNIFSGFDLSYRQLSRYFKLEYGMSPKKYQIICKLEEAKRLLVNTSFSITTIAIELGFPSSQHFTMQFKKSLGISPSSYRSKVNSS